MSRTLVTADWVLPVTSTPIRDGGVLVEDQTIVACGKASDLRESAHGATVVDYPGCIVTPGLVNAHTHLVLSAAGGLLEPAPFVEWLPRLVKGISSMTAEQQRASAALGAIRCLEAGVTVVGDIAYGIESLEAAREAGVGGVFFWEILGIEAEGLFTTLERTGFPLSGSHGTDRDIGGISPHSVYTSGPQLLAAVHTFSSVGDIPLAIHLSESQAEVDLTLKGDGGLVGVAQRSAHGFTPPGTTPVHYLHSVGALEGAALIHMGYADNDDLALVAAAARGVVACPRSNAFLHNRVADVERLLSMGCPVGLGTDSAASNADLDLMREARALRDECVPVTDHDLIELLTLGGATVLGIDDRFGSLAQGKQADLSVWRVPVGADPEGAFVQYASADNVEAVMSGGTWRLMGGRLLTDVAELLASSNNVTASIRDSLER